MSTTSSTTTPFHLQRPPYLLHGVDSCPWSHAHLTIGATPFALMMQLSFTCSRVAHTVRPPRPAQAPELPWSIKCSTNLAWFSS
eukprot:5630983-Amphidinium_carterae.1